MNRKYKSTHQEFKKKNKKTIYDKLKPTKKKDNKEEEKEPILSALSSHLNLPGDIIAGAPIITATGRNVLCIENYKGIIEYNSSIIKVQTKICKICVEGTNLNIDYFTNDEMKISGCIKAINYI
ncbi:YabP/YqfC family sporulation protein [Anaeromicropila herbilytica]|uniref:Sporulation protein YqfC n=1 Tax=Anaeromicropila herbilytica TaxID=2785025 RepID=A0A7R7EL27_9FIRM|nr:YabP/YqfC family sporulation protein [Anaeromicropila herbilytica]BCN30571.1 hypothetical protein bsdtb5_18660 [Anaeromicropila herbilytica]